MRQYSGLCVGGPLDGKTWEGDYYQFQYPDEPPMTASAGYDPSMTPGSVSNSRVGLYMFNRDYGIWQWSI